MAGSSIGRTSDFGSESWRFEPSPASEGVTLLGEYVAEHSGDSERVVSLERVASRQRDSSVVRTSTGELDRVLFEDDRRGAITP